MCGRRRRRSWPGGERIRWSLRSPCSNAAPRATNEPSIGRQTCATLLTAVSGSTVAQDSVVISDLKQHSPRQRSTQNGPTRHTHQHSTGDISTLPTVGSTAPHECIASVLQCKRDARYYTGSAMQEPHTCPALQGLDTCPAMQGLEALRDAGARDLTRAAGSGVPRDAGASTPRCRSRRARPRAAGAHV